MSISRKIRRAAARSASPAQPQTPPPVRFPQVRAALDMANRLLDQGRSADALDLCRQVLPIEPQHPEVHFTIATIHEVRADVAAAVAAYGKVVELAPAFLPGLVNYAACLAQAGRYGAALDIYGRALKLAPDNAVVHQGLADILTRLRRYDKALPHHEFLARQRGEFLDLTELAIARDRAGDTEGALKAFEAAGKLTTNQCPIFVSMARVEQMRGNRQAARRFIDEALAADPHDGYAHLSKAQYFTQPDEVESEIAAIRQALAQTAGRPADSAAAPLNFALGRLLAGKDANDEAFQAYAEANRLIAARQVNDDDESEAELRQRLKNLDAGRLEALKLYGNPTRQPVFILGMPRSGTTLIEQMLASHHQVYGLGEVELLPNLAAGLQQPDRETISETVRLYLEAWPAKARRALRVSDKSISSYRYIDLILLMFPNAAVIACERHPMDNAWSIFTEYFNDNALVYSYDLKRIARQLKLHRDIMDHWDKLLPGHILTLRYEDVVNDAEGSARRLIAHTGLEWDDEVLSFHESARVIRTASLEQVRQPIYKSSVGKWRRFAPHLQALSQDLADLIDRYEKAHP